jgi:hypothetical protein
MRALILVAGLALATAACGSDDDPIADSNTVLHYEGNVLFACDNQGCRQLDKGEKPVKPGAQHQ